MWGDWVIYTGEVLGAVSIVLGSIAVLWRYVIGPLVLKVAEHYGEFLAKVDSIPTIMQQVDQIANEIRLDDDSDLTIAQRLAMLNSKVLASEQIQDYMMLDSNVASFRSNEVGEITSVNREFATMVGSTPGELTHNGWVALLATDDTVARRAILDSWEGAWKMQHDLMLPSVRFVLPNGNIVPVRIVAYKLVVGTKYIGHIGFVKRLTDPKRRSDDPESDDFTQERNNILKELKKFKRDDDL